MLRGVSHGAFAHRHQVANNRLVELPKFLGSLPELKTLQCGKNPFRKDMVVPKNIVSKGDDAILTYLQALHGVGDGSLDTVKCVLSPPLPGQWAA